MKYATVQRYYDDGKIKATFIHVPDNTESSSKECLRYDEYIDVFNTQKEAEDHIKACKKA